MCCANIPFYADMLSCPLAPTSVPTVFTFHCERFGDNVTAHVRMAGLCNYSVSVTCVHRTRYLINSCCFTNSHLLTLMVATDTSYTLGRHAEGRMIDLEFRNVSKLCYSWRRCRSWKVAQPCDSAIPTACEHANIETLRAIGSLLDERFAADKSLAVRFPDRPAAKRQPGSSLMTHVKDGPGHSRRYAIDPTRSATQLAFEPAETLTTGLRRTGNWYLTEHEWWKAGLDGSYRSWIAIQYGNFDAVG